jgi:hypothetical protein
VFDDLVKPKNRKKKKTILRSSDITVEVEFLEDIQEVIWDLATEPCMFCGQETGAQHEDTCKYMLVMGELDYQFQKHRRS